MRKLCKHCLADKTLTIKDSFTIEDELFDHIEMVHDLVIRREGETTVEAVERVKKKNPRIGTENCQCPKCRHKRASLLN